MTHDYIVYKAYEDELMFRYNTHIIKLGQGIKKLIAHLNLSGQWSIDIMQNGNDFWVNPFLR